MKLGAAIRQHPKLPHLTTTLKTGPEPATWHHASLVHHAKELYALAKKAALVPELEQEAIRLLQLIPAPPSEAAIKEWAEHHRKAKQARQEAKERAFWSRPENEIYADLLYLLMKGIDEAGGNIAIDVLACYRPYMDAFKFLNQNNLLRKFDFLGACKRTILKASKSGLLETIRRGHQTFVNMTPEGKALFNQRKQEEEESEYI
jgi:hypothetical protein